MPMWGRTDTDTSKPTWPRERTVRYSKITISTNGVSNIFTGSSNTRIYLPNTTGVANGMFVTGVSGNTGKGSFHDTSPYVVNVTATSVWLSANLSANVNNNTPIRFDTPISYKANSRSKDYNANTFLVDATRIATGTVFGNGKGVAHQGWIHVRQGTGPIKNVTIGSSNGSGFAVNSSGYILIWGDQYGPATNANIAYTTTGNGNLKTVSVTSGGSGFRGNTAAQTLSSNQYFNSSGSANTPATWPVLNFTYGGRAGRITTEVLTVIANPSVTNSSSGGQYFTGT